MPQIEISESQREYLEELRTHIAEEHVGPYGHVRMRDVVQFLIDHHEETGERDLTAATELTRHLLADQSYQQLQSLAADTEGVEPGGKAPELRDRLVQALVQQFFGSPAAEAKSNGEGSPGTASDDRSTSAGSAEPDEVEAGEVEADEAETDESGTAETDDATEAAEEDSTGENEQESRLQRMMGLLDRHGDVWEEQESDQGKYAVTLPDGSVENVRTKDDVRALLFKHYD